MTLLISLCVTKTPSAPGWVHSPEPDPHPLPLGKVMIRPVLGVWSGLFGTPVLRPGRERRRFDVYPRTTEFTLPSVSRTQTLRNHLLVVLSTKAREPVPYTFSTLFPRDLVPLCSYCHNGHEHTSDRSLGHDQVGVMY